MGKAYKLFRIKNDKLYPLYVNAKKEVAMCEWIEAECGELVDETHVKANGCGGKLALRPGWHLAEIPNANWIGEKYVDSDGITRLQKRKDTVWCECEYADEINYQPYVNKIGRKKTGHVVPRDAMMREIPVKGFYRYKCNSQGDVWIISGAIKVLRKMTDDEVADICRSFGVEPQKTA